MSSSGRTPKLTRRERQVLIELCRPALTRGPFAEPASVRDMARALFVTEAAIKQHLIRLYRKFDLHDRSTRRRVLLANEVLERGIIRASDLETDDDERTRDHVEAGRAALGRRAWREAFESLSRAEEEGADLGADDLARLGEAALWSGDVDASQAARLRAYHAYVEAHDERAAALVALALVINHVVRLRFTVAAGWASKARRHLEHVPEGVEHGHLAVVESMFSLVDGDLDAVLEKARRAFELGQRHGSRDLTALGLVFQASALAQLGRRDEAGPLFDEAMASAATGELHPLATGLVFCRTLCACIDLFDYRRALDWSAEVERAREERGAGGFPGDCRAHRAQILLARGQWAEAEREAAIACSEARSFDFGHVGLAELQLGILRLRKGKLEEAEAAFQRAIEFGAVAQPGLSLLSLARGDANTAASSISAALEQVRAIPLRRAQLLPAQVEIALASGALETADAAATELEDIAHDYGTMALRAAARCARGAVAAASDDPVTAVEALREGSRLWLELGAPFEAARARVRLGQALGAEGNAPGRLAELRSAQKEFERLGATMDAARVARELEGA